MTAASPEGSNTAIFPGVNPQLSIPLRVLWWVFALIPTGCSLGVLATMAVDGPYADDFDAVLGFLNRFHGCYWSAPTEFGEFHNEHRVVVTRFLTWSTYGLTGYVSFAVLMIVGNGLLILLAGVLMRGAVEIGIKDFWLIPIPCVLLACQSADNALGGMQSVQNLAVHCFAGLAFYFVPRRKVVALVLGLVATVTSACGLFVLPIMAAYGLVTAWLESDRRVGQCLWRWWQQAGFWLAVAGIGVWNLYFWGYKTPAGHISPLISLQHPSELATFFLLLTGAPLVRFGVPATLAAGALGLLILVLVLRTVDWRKNALFIQLAMFELATIVVISLARCAWGPETALAFRYRIIPLTLLTCVYALSAGVIVRYIPLQLNRGIGLFLAIVAVVANAMTLRDSLPIYRNHFEMMNRQMASGITVENLVYPDQQRALRIALESDRKGIFRWTVSKDHSK